MWGQGVEALFPVDMAILARRWEYEQEPAQPVRAMVEMGRGGGGEIGQQDGPPPTTNVGASAIRVVVGAPRGRHSRRGPRGGRQRRARSSCATRVCQCLLASAAAALAVGGDTGGARGADEDDIGGGGGGGDGGLADSRGRCLRGAAAEVNSEVPQLRT